MSKTEFDKFVQRQQIEETETAAFDPERQLQEWRDYLDVLYKEINGYMAAYIESGSASVEYNDVDLNEEFSGPYTVPQMLLKIGRSTVEFKPIGTMLIGSKGRVDVQGPRGGARLALVNRKVTLARQLIRVTVSVANAPRPPTPAEATNEPIEWAWKIITSPPEMRFIELTRDAFFDMILSVADA